MALLINPYRFGSTDPAALFQGGDTGFMFTLANTTSLWQNTDGTGAVSADGDSVRRVTSVAPDTGKYFSGSNPFTYKTGTNPYLRLPNSTDNLSGTATMAGMLNAAPGATFGFAGYCSDTTNGVPLFYASATNYAVGVYFEGTTRQINIEHKRNGSSQYLLSPGNYQSTKVAIVGVWDFPGNIIRLYVNGTQVASATPTSSGNFPSENASAFSLHASWSGGSSDLRCYAGYGINRVLNSSGVGTLSTWLATQAGI